MMTTTMMPVLSTGWNLCRCQCCVWTLLMTSSPRLMVSPSDQIFCAIWLHHSDFLRIIMKGENWFYKAGLLALLTWHHEKWESSPQRRHQNLNPFFALQPFQWRQWSRIQTWPCSSPVMAAILVSSRACGLDRALTWIESSSSLLRRSLNKAADSKTSPDKRT